MVNHSIKQMYNKESKILILGSFPSVKSREEGFYYAHPKNRFWKVLSLVLGENLPVTVEEKKNMLLKHRIALWDVIASCDIIGSSDSSIENVTPNNLLPMIKESDIKVIYCNGTKAFSLYNKYIYPSLSKENIINANAVLLPSTSPANAAKSVDELTNSWRRILTGLKRENFRSAYYSLNDYANDIYEKKLYRLALDGGFTCPNRDGKIGYGGCIFCSAAGSGDFASESGLSIKKQIQSQKELIKNKLPKTKKVGYIAYFQAFTSTYAPVEKLRELYLEAANNDSIDVISIATRPDVLPDDVLKLIEEINNIKPVWVELGLQTIHPKTAEYIRRGYDLKVYNRAVNALKNIGISQIITHIILGLPGESESMMIKTVKHALKTGSNGLKLSLLHVLKNTDLAKDYENGLFETMSLDDYARLLKDILGVIPPDTVLHRFTGDGNKKELLAPLWSGDKKHVLNTINKVLSE
ncbi:MAG: TIGR01212 family radical SAM protein [Eubacterium sp.]|nr:TIGR01212 family radical SAM protein [Eubacterium sp.]